MKEALIIFVKNPLLGKVKTRIAQSVGDETALKIYQELLAQTKSVTRPWTGHKYVFYDQYVDHNDMWPESEYFKRVQAPGDLGNKMYNAFEELFHQYDKLVIIGSDCYQLTTPILVKAFSELDHKDVVIGPSLDGGYYLLGLSELHKEIFEQIPWSTERVFQLTVDRINQLDLSHTTLPLLRDVDHYEDWIEQIQAS